jgi:hypothetical protein
MPLRSRDRALTLNSQCVSLNERALCGVGSFLFRDRISPNRRQPIKEISLRGHYACYSLNRLRLYCRF